MIASECKFQSARQRDWEEEQAKADVEDEERYDKAFNRIRNEHTMYNEALAKDRLILAARQKAVLAQK